MALQVEQILQVHLPVRVDREVAPIALPDEHLPDPHAFDLPARAEDDLGRRQLTAAIRCSTWSAAGMIEAETRFRKVEGYRGLATLAFKIEHDVLRNRQLDSHTSTEETTMRLTV